MLKQRLITGLLLGSFVIYAIFYFSSDVFAWTVTGFMLIAAWEWSFLMAVDGLPKRLGYCIAVLASFVFFSIVGELITYSLAALFWMMALACVVVFPRYSDVWAGSKLRLSLIGILLIAPTWSALIYLQGAQAGPLWLLYVFLLVWGADTGAYFVGRKFGKRKLAPNASPGKSIEGMLGGVATSGLIALVAFWWVDIALLNWLCIAILTTLVSVLGDLFESIVKRHRGVKDSGNILPGHGGLLDRIDSLFAAAPIFVGLYLLLG